MIVREALPLVKNMTASKSHAPIDEAPGIEGVFYSFVEGSVREMIDTLFNITEEITTRTPQGNRKGRKHKINGQTYGEAKVQFLRHMISRDVDYGERGRERPPIETKKRTVFTDPFLSHVCFFVLCFERNKNEGLIPQIILKTYGSALDALRRKLKRILGKLNHLLNISEILRDEYTKIKKDFLYPIQDIIRRYNESHQNTPKVPPVRDEDWEFFVQRVLL